MSEFKPGEIVDITIKGARVDGWVPETSELTVESTADANSELTAFDLTSDQITVERVAPAEWPPRPGDLWRDREGDVWFAVEDEDGTITMVCQVTACVSRPPDEFMRTLDPLTFVYREDEPDGGTR